MVLPLALGQLARFTPLRKLHERKPKVISRMSECVLLSIIYTTFCDTFASQAGEGYDCVAGAREGYCAFFLPFSLVTNEWKP